MHYHIAHGCPIELVLTWYHHQPESYQLSLTKVSHLQTDGQSDPKIGPGLPGSDKNCQQTIVKMLVRSCFLMTLIKCLKGHKSLGSLCNVKSKSTVSQ